MYLVTGAAGFVGSQLVRHLRECGDPVRAMVRRGSTSRIDLPDVEVVEGDLRDEASLARAVDGVGAVYHIAALFRQAGLRDADFFDVNASGTERLLQASITAGVKRFIHCSTVGVLGHVADPPADETTPYNPGDVYQRSKVEGEKIALDYFRQERIWGVVIRPAMIYGPGDTRTLKLFRMINRRRFFYVGKGDAYVHFVDVRDLARAFRLAMMREHLNGGIYIAVGSRAIILREMVDLVARKLDVPPPRLHLPVRPMQIAGTLCEAICKPVGIEPPIFRRRVDFFTKSRYFDGSKAGRELEFVPAQNFEQEIDDIIASYRDRDLL